MNPEVVMERVSLMVERYPGMTRTQVAGYVTGRRGSIYVAIGQLIGSGHVEERIIGHRRTLVSVRPYRMPPELAGEVGYLEHGDQAEEGQLSALRTLLEQASRGTPLRAVPQIEEHVSAPAPSRPVGPVIEYLDVVRQIRDLRLASAMRCVWGAAFGNGQDTQQQIAQAICYLQDYQDSPVGG